MKKVIVCLLVLFVLIGCVQVQEEDPEAEDDTQATVKETTTKEADEETPSYVLSNEIKDLIAEQLLPGVRSSMPLAHKTMKSGDSYVFGIGIQNIKPTSEQFIIQVDFKKAYDKYTNSIDTDEETMDKWLKTKFESFELDYAEKQTVAIVMEADNIMAGKKPSLGTYVFNLRVLHRNDNTMFRDEYVGRKEISIRIEK